MPTAARVLPPPRQRPERQAISQEMAVLKMQMGIKQVLAAAAAASQSSRGEGENVTPPNRLAGGT